MGERYKIAAHYIEENVKAVRLGRVRGDEENKRDRVDRARLGHDRGLPRETEGLARVAQSGLARPQAIGDEHYIQYVRENGEIRGEQE